MTKNYHDLWVCSDCYMEHHYPGEAERCDGLTLATRYGSAELTDNTCAEHDGDSETECQYCGQADYENGVTEFSKAPCDGCGSVLAGRRERLAYWPKRVAS